MSAAARAALLLALAACGRGDAGGASPAAAAVPAPVRAQLDSGNAAYRLRDYPAALRHYREAARLGPDQAPAWYGVQMAAGALGDRAAADSAGARLRALAPATPPAVHHPGAAPAPPPPSAAT